MTDIRVSDRPIRRVLLAPLLLLTLLAPSQLAAQQTPTSRWWYPLGSPEATRRNDVPTTNQSASDLVIKWRTSALRGARTLLVGALSTPSDSPEQQIVGMRQGFDTITILDQYGFVDTSFSAVARERSETHAVALTGLFNASAGSVIPEGRPGIIGVALEREVLSSTENSLQAYGLLLRPDGSVRTRLGLSSSEAEQIRLNTRSSNRFTTIYPAALFTPPGRDSAVAFALLSQDQFYRDSTTSPGDVWLNGLRTYRIPPGLAGHMGPVGTPFRIAPRTWGSQPAMTYMSGPAAHLLSLATEAYQFSDTVRSPLQAEASRTHEASAMHLQISDGSLTVRGVSEHVSSGTRASRSLFSTITIDRTTGAENLFLRFAWDLRESRTGVGPRLWLTNVNESRPQGNVIAPDSLPYNGYNLLVADLDGTQPGAPETDPLLVNNPGNEIILSRTSEGSEQIQVMIYRYNDRFPIGTQSLGTFTQQRIRGRLVAAGDLVADAEQRWELIQLDRDSLRVLQFRSYVNEGDLIAPFNPELAEPLAVIASFGLGDTVLNAVIADVEGDGENDIIASTPSGTFLIGRQVTPAFAWTLEPIGVRLCPTDTIEISWRRRTVGSEGGIRVTLIGPDGSIGITSPSVLTGNRLYASPRDLNMTKPGEYRLVVSDALYPYLSDTSNPFVYVAPQLDALRFETSGEVLPGTELLDTIAVRCVDEVRLEASSDGTTWRGVSIEEGEITPLPGTDSARVRVVLPCPDVAECGEVQGAASIRYRLVSLGDTVSVDAIPLAVELIDLAIGSGDTGRSRTHEIVWDTSGVTCELLSFTLIAADGTPIDIGNVDAVEGSFTLEIPEELSDSVWLCVGCADPTGCSRGMIAIELPETPEGDYIAPNPFSPTRRSPGENGATIAFSVDEPTRVTIRIIDAGRSTLRQIVQEMPVESGRHSVIWDGKADDGGILANGTYFCVISFTTGESIILPFIVIQ